MSERPSRENMSHEEDADVDAQEYVLPEAEFPEEWYEEEQGQKAELQDAALGAPRGPPITHHSEQEQVDQSNLKLRAVISPKRALIVQSPWASLLVDGEKTVEIRGSATKMFGSIAIAQSKSKLLIGEVTLESCCLIAVRDEDGRLQDVPGSLHTLDSLKDAHRIKDVGSIPYGKVYAWFVTKCVKYDTPVSYVHPRGAVVWVSLLPKSEEKKEQKARKAMKASKDTKFKARIFISMHIVQARFSDMVDSIS